MPVNINQMFRAKSMPQHFPGCVFDAEFCLRNKVPTDWEQAQQKWKSEGHVIPSILYYYQMPMDG